MLDISLAEKLIERVTEYTDYNINIMNDKGIIIASRDSRRIGTFHEAAYQILNSSKDIITINSDNDYPGALPGINMVIDIDGNRVGVVGVTGIPEEIRPVALIIKMAFETLIKYETQKLRSIQRQSNKDRFAEMLTHENHSEPEHIRRLAEELNYHEDIPRIPILCRPEQPDCLKELLGFIKADPLHQREDISFLLDDRYILIFKTLNASEQSIFSDYKYLLADYLRSTLHWLRTEDLRCRFYIGTFQSSFTQYYYAYHHCCWLENNIHTAHSAVYFYDHIREYMEELIPKNELQRIFNVFGKQLPEAAKDSYQELVGSLLDQNFNISAASKQIFMHKNTFTYNYNKIRDMLNVNPQLVPSDKWLLTYLYIYLSHK